MFLPNNGWYSTNEVSEFKRTDLEFDIEHTQLKNWTEPKNMT